MAQILKCLLLLLIVCTFANGLVRRRRLAGGTNSNIGQFPYMAAIKFKDSLVCGGAIIGPKKILTAAKCIDQCVSKIPEYHKDCQKFMTVVIGTNTLSSGGNIYRVKNVKIPDSFAAGKFASDIGIITLQSDIKYNENVKPINLPDKDIVEDTIAITSGWGSKREPKAIEDRFTDILQNLKETIISPEKCNKLHDQTKIKVDNADFCAKSIPEKAGLCVGDSGNPLVQDGKIIGISTWGIGCDGQYPDVYTNVFKYLDFIKKEL